MSAIVENLGWPCLNKMSRDRREEGPFIIKNQTV